MTKSGQRTGHCVRAWLWGLAFSLVGMALAQADELSVASSGGFAAAFKLLKPGYEAQSGNQLSAVWGPSMGETAGAIPKRLQRGEPIDVVIMVGDALTQLVAQGQVLPDHAVVLARSRIAMVVKAGAPKPDISTVQALTQTLLNARSIAYSDSASGVYLAKVLFARLGVADKIQAKSRMIPAEPVAQVVARGEAEIGFQQLSELLPVPGVDVVGMLPDEAQQVTLFSAGVVAKSAHQDQAKALIDYLAAPTSAALIRQTGLDPAH